MIARKGSGFDIILVSGEPYVDHPMSPAGVIARVLEAAGYKVGIIDRPDWKTDRDLPQARGAAPVLRRHFGLHRQHARQLYPAQAAPGEGRARPLCLGHARPGRHRLLQHPPAALSRLAPRHRRHRGVAPSLRPLRLLGRRGPAVHPPRFPRRHPRLRAGRASGHRDRRAARPGRGPRRDPRDVRRPAGAPAGIPGMPSLRGRARRTRSGSTKPRTPFPTGLDLAQPHAERFVLQYAAPEYAPADLDRIYGLPFSRAVPADFPEFAMAQFSVVTHRGCFGRCSFCALSLHQGDRIVSRSEASILDEIRRLTQAPGLQRLYRRPRGADGEHVRDGLPLGLPREGMPEVPAPRPEPPAAHRPDEESPRRPGRQKGLRPERHPVRPGPGERGVRPGALRTITCPGSSRSPPSTSRRASSG